MSEDLNLPASLERLEISPERADCCKNEIPRTNLVLVPQEPECTLQTLSLKDDCPKGTCQCNRKKDKEATVKRLSFKRPILRRSKLNSVLLRSPVLKLKEAVSHPNDEIPLSRPISRLSGSSGVSLEDGPEGVESASGSTQACVASSCAVQARITPDDTTIDELASYFDLFVHIPKKMSFMAEMMYT